MNGTRGSETVGDGARVTHETGRAADGDLVDALLICEPGQARGGYATLLAAEGYRVRIVDTIATAALSLRSRRADIGFIPSAEAQMSAGPWRRRVEALAIPLVVLGDGWTQRVRAASNVMQIVELRAIAGGPS